MPRRDVVITAIGILSLGVLVAYLLAEKKKEFNVGDWVTVNDKYKEAFPRSFPQMKLPKKIESKAPSTFHKDVYIYTLDNGDEINECWLELAKSPEIQLSATDKRFKKGDTVTLTKEAEKDFRKSGYKKEIDAEWPTTVIKEDIDTNSIGEITYIYNLSNGRRLNIGWLKSATPSTLQLSSPIWSDYVTTAQYWLDSEFQEFQDAPELYIEDRFKLNPANFDAYVGKDYPSEFWFTADEVEKCAEILEKKEIEDKEEAWSDEEFVSCVVDTLKAHVMLLQTAVQLS